MEKGQGNKEGNLSYGRGTSQKRGNEENGKK
jgi:hypothetical protein